MRVVNPGEVWMIDFGMAAKVRPALSLLGSLSACRRAVVAAVSAAGCQRAKVDQHSTLNNL